MQRLFDATHYPVRAAGWSCLVLLLSTSAFFVGRLILNGGLLPDFTVFWAAAKNLAAAYDETALTSAQSFAVSPAHGLRPFVYPPPALLALAPFGLLPFWPAYGLWIGLSASAFWTAARRITSVRNSWCALASPHSILVLILGQTTLLIGAAIIWALTLLQRNPLAAGVILGVAAAIKPQSLMLVPLALVAGRHWRSMPGTAAGFVATAAISLVLGPRLWLEWWNDLHSFSALLEFYHLDRIGAAPAMAARVLGYGPPAAVIIQGAGIVLGCVVVWRTFRSTSDADMRLISLVSGTILASPYAMRYELAMLAPALVPALLSGRLRGLAVAAPMLAMNAVVAVIAMVISSALTAAGARPAPSAARAGGPGRHEAPRP